LVLPAKPWWAALRARLARRQLADRTRSEWIVRNDDITVNPSPSAAEERSEDAVTLKAANDEAAWQLQRMSGPCNYDASTLSSAAPPVR
jgi:hypothetical protein